MATVQPDILVGIGIWWLGPNYVLNTIGGFKFGGIVQLMIEYIHAGESCVVYKGYHASQYSTDMIAIKTLKGMNSIP